LFVLLQLKLILKEESGRTWTGLIWLRLGTSSGLLWTLWWCFWIHKAGDVVRNLKGLCFMELAEGNCSVYPGQQVKRKQLASLLEWPK